MAVASLADGGGDAKIIAGGQSLVPMLNFRLLRPSILVDINRIGDLAFIQETGKNIMCRRAHAPFSARNLAGDRRGICRFLPCAMTHVAHLAIRNRGTIGGSLAHADPAAELPMMALLLDAELSIASTSRQANDRRARFFPGCADGRSRRRRHRHRNRAAEATAGNRLGFRRSCSPQRRFRARRRRQRP